MCSLVFGGQAVGRRHHKSVAMRVVDLEGLATGGEGRSGGAETDSVAGEHSEQAKIQ